MTSHNNGARLRAGLAAVAAATALLATAGGAAPANAAPAPAPHSGAGVSGDLYWSNTTASGNSMIGRARLDGTQVNQQFIEVPNADILLGVALDPGPHD